MALPPNRDAPYRITSARDDVLAAVAQTACVATALRALDLQVGALAATVYERPEDAIAVCTRETALDRRQRRKRILDTLSEIRKRVDHLAVVPGLFGPQAHGHVLNRMIVTHTIALLEGFVDGAGEPFLKAINRQRFSPSFRAKCRELEPVCDLSAASGYADVDLLATIRHVIVHRNGACDARFLTEVRASRSVLACQLQSLSVGDQVRIPIDDLVLPALQGVTQFVQDAAGRLLSKA